jgi:hypothetical protein
MKQETINRSAQQVIDKCYGAHDPLEYVNFRIRKLEEEYDDEGVELWKKIALAIVEIANQTGKGKPN